jgi:hypothetical protein
MFKFLNKKRTLIGSGSSTATAFPSDGCRTGVIDYQDTATQTTPISLPATGEFQNLTNDGLGSFSVNFAPQGVTDVWDTTNNELDLSELRVGDFINIRIDLFVNPAANTEVNTDLLFFANDPSPVSVLFTKTFFKSGAADQKLLVFSGFYVGSEDVRTKPIKIRAAADNATEVKVNGWAIQIFTRGPI